MFVNFACVCVQVLPHPCDRDYQHAEGLQGCAPVVFPNQRTSLGLVNMDKMVRHAMPMGKEYATHAQTLRRSGYVNMLGRPPFDYSDGTALRKSGFLSADTLLGQSGDTIFVPCKSVKQCFEDKFTHHAKEVTRRVFIEAASQVVCLCYLEVWLPAFVISKCGCLHLLSLSVVACICYL